MKNSVRRIPKPTKLLLQSVVFMLILVISVDFVIFLSEVRKIPVLAFWLFGLACYLVWVVLSLTIGNNSLLTFVPDGLNWKKKLKRWEEALSIGLRRGIPIQGGRPTIMTIYYSDGEAIQLEIDEPRLKDFRTFCKDQHFLQLMDKSLEDFGFQ